MKFDHLLALGVVAVLFLLTTTAHAAVSPGTTMAALDVPEPASLSLLAVGGMALLLRRHKR